MAPGSLSRQALRGGSRESFAISHPYLTRIKTVSIAPSIASHAWPPLAMDAVLPIWGTMIKKYSAPFSGLAAVLAPMAGITIETRGVGRRGSATRSGIRANLASCGPLHHRFDALHCRDTGAAQPRGRARPASTLLRMIDRSNSEQTPSVWNMARPPAWSYRGLADADRDRILQHRAPRGSRPSGATIGRGGQLTRPQDISPRCGSRYNNGFNLTFLDQ